MQKVITINLNGNAYQLDEHGYEALHAYLVQAETQLGTNPDKAEIIRDLEQAIAEKCLRHLGPGKGVVTTADVEHVLGEIGPVDSGSVSAPQGSTSETPPPRRLYQIREGAMLSGVCNGLAAYFNVDPTIVRVAFAIAAVTEMTVYDNPPVFTIGLYLLLMFIVPYAKTSEQRAAAQGASAGLPYKLQTIVERVKAKIPGLHPRTR